MIKIGEFHLGDKVVVSDPCYKLDTWCSEVVENVKSGLWSSFIKKSDEGMWGIRVSELTANHNDYKLNNWEHYSSNIGVDSGQAGVFDFEYYRRDEHAKPSAFIDEETQKEEGEKWYSACCDLTCGTDEKAGVMVGGVVSSTGLGDGQYDLFVQREEANKIVAFKIVFISDKEEEEDEEEFCEECQTYIEFCRC